jgi:hypothetical protein
VVAGSGKELHPILWYHWTSGAFGIETDWPIIFAETAKKKKQNLKENMGAGIKLSSEDS